MVRNNMWIKTLKKTFIIITILLPLNAFANENKIESRTDKISNLTILSEDGMTYPLVKIARIYCEFNNSTVSINFNNSRELIKNIEDGEPADIFISSHQDWTDELKQKGLIDIYNLVNLAKDSLVLVTTRNNNKIDNSKINQFSNTKAILKEMKNKGNKLIVDSLDTSLGKYTNTILQQDNFPNQEIGHINPKNKKSITNFINENSDYYGIILKNSVKNYDNILILKTIEDIEINYQALVIASNNMDEARKFLEFLKSKQAKEIFAASGFIVE